MPTLLGPPTTRGAIGPGRKVRAMEDRKSTSPKANPDDDPKRGGLEGRMRSSAWYLIMALVAMWAFQEFVLAPLERRSTEISYSDFKQKLADGQVVDVV